jgi:protein gp37
MKPGEDTFFDGSQNVCGGCRHISPGCWLCYAAQQAGRLQQRSGAKREARSLYVGTVDELNDGRCVFNGTLTVVRTGHPEWIMPLTWKGVERPRLGRGKPSLIFLGSMCEIFLPERPKWIIDRLVATIAASDHIGFFLTKCPDVMAEYFAAPQSATTLERWQKRLWLGFSAENQLWFDKRWPHMRALAEQGWIVFTSLGPLIGPVTLPEDFLALGDRGWVIVSGEEGKHERCRRMDSDWGRRLRDQCRDADVPFFMRQLDRKRPLPPDLLNHRQFPRGWWSDKK